MKALDIMEAAGGIDDEIIQEVTSAMQEKNTGKPLRAKRTLRTVLIAAALVLVLAGSALAAGRLINSPAQAVKVARQEIAKMQDMGILSSEYRYFDGEPDYLGEAPNTGVSDYWFGRIFPHSYIVRGGTADGKYYMNLFVDTMSGKIIHISTEAKADETDTPIPGGDVTVETGNGTETDPYQIGTADGLKLFRDIVNGSNGQTQNRGACAVLTADIDLNNEEWTPIGPSESSAYTGTFDGQGHTVRNLSITGDVKRAGLFGCVIGGAIRKLTVAGSVSCTVDQGWCGGIAGYAERETIENCASLCTVSYTGKDARVGGIVGYVPSSSSMTIICDCYNIGNITGSSDTGGICGYNLSGRIFNCYNVGEITGGNYVSKIVGYGQANNNPTNCYYLSDTDTDPAAKTAAEFADRTVVLKLLKAGRNDSPWDSCQYVATAGITLPVFNGQGDAHNANGGRQEQLRVTKQLFVVSELLVGQAAKFLPGKTANKEIARDNIIILKGTVQRQTIHFARIVADKRHIVL